MVTHKPHKLLTVLLSTLTLMFLACVNAAPGPAGVATAAAVLEEVVVTARKREESLQDTPLSITAFSGDLLENKHIDSLDGIASSTPNMMFDTGTSFSGATTAAAIYIRGIGQLDFTLNSEPGVGVYLDGVYIATTIGSVLDLVDIEQVEVLRGPQGTLFGRNTIGGAINITSRKPDDSVHGDLKVTAGAYDRIDLRGSINLPISETLFAKVSAASYNRDGFVESPAATSGDMLGDINRDAIRGQLRFVPGDKFEALFSADYSRQRENGVPSVLLGTFPGTSLAAIAALGNPASPGFLPPPAPLPPLSFIDLFNTLAVTPLGEQGGIAGFFPGVVPNPVFGQATVGQAGVTDLDKGVLRNNATIDLASDTDIWGVTLSLAYDMDWLTLKSITSYRDMEAKTGFNTGGVAQGIAQLGNTYASQQVSQEIQVAGIAFDKRLNWLLGFYHFEQNGLNLDDVEFTAVRVLSGAKIDNRSTAGFAQATFDVSDRLSLTAGLRYSDETKKFSVPDTCYDLPRGAETLFDGSTISCAQMHSVIDPKFANAGFLTFVSAPVFPAPGGRFCCLPVSDADGNIVGLLPGLNAGDELLPRGTFRESYSDLTTHASIAWHWSEDLMSYFSYAEGFKSGGYVQRVFPPRTAPPAFDPESAVLYELGVKWTGFDRRLRLSAAGFHTRYKDMHIQVNDGIAAVTRNAAAAEINGFELELTATPASGWLLQTGVGYLDAQYTELQANENLVTDVLILDRTSKLVNTPDWSLNVGVQYTLPLASGAQIVSRLDFSHTSEVYKDALNFPQIHQDGYQLLDLGLSFIDASGNWELSVFGRNITDERYIVSGYANALTIGSAVANVGRPAEWGVSIAWHFGA